MISHGAAQFLKERLYDQSDAFSVTVCDLCGLIAIANLKTGDLSCPACDNHSQLSTINVPYAFKLLVQELMAMSLAPRLFTETAAVFQQQPQP